MTDKTTPRPLLIGINDERATELMVAWFRENYEDAAERTPYESAEGGYQYIWGGPIDAREELDEKFPSASEAALNAAVEEIEADGDEWVPVPHASD